MEAAACAPPAAAGDIEERPSLVGALTEERRPVSSERELAVVLRGERVELLHLAKAPLAPVFEAALRRIS